MSKFSEACEKAVPVCDGLDLLAIMGDRLTPEGRDTIRAWALTNLEKMADREPGHPTCGHGLASVLSNLAGWVLSAVVSGDPGQVQAAASNVLVGRVITLSLLSAHDREPPDRLAFLEGRDIGQIIACAQFLHTLCDDEGWGGGDGDPEPEPGPAPTPTELEPA